MHTIRIEEISRFGDVICIGEVNVNIVNQKYNGAVCLDTPTNNSTLVKQTANQVLIKGWAVSGDRNAIVQVKIDSNVVIGNCQRQQRVDVDSIVSPGYGGTNCTPNAGFFAYLNMSGLGVGNHTIRIEEISRYGDLISALDFTIRIINQQYLGEMCIDSPTYNQAITKGNNITVAGWAVAQDEAAFVELYIDGKSVGTASRYYRQDIVPFMNKYGGKTVNAGFGRLVSSSNLTVGVHKLTAYEKSRYGDIIGGVEVPFTVISNQPVSSNTTIISNTNYNNTNVSGSKGIDVSQYQGNINWSSVAKSGMKYAMIRIGYRGYGTGGLAEDPKFKTNFAGAVNNGIKTGVYFYSTAINTAEAQADADYVISILKKYGYQGKVSMPIALDLELIPGVNTRDKNVSKAMRTSIANTFCARIASYGYKPMVYACKSFLNSNMNAGSFNYDVWVAQYSSKCSYGGKYTMWQYTDKGSVSGISGNVDVNICYKNY